MQNNIFIFLNGKIIPDTDAHISSADRGFLYGDGIYETLRSYNGKPFKLDEHLERMRHSVKQLRISFEYTNADIGKIIDELIVSQTCNNGPIAINHVIQEIDCVSIPWVGYGRVPTLSNKAVEKVEAHANNNNQLYNIRLPKWLHLNCWLWSMYACKWNRYTVNVVTSDILISSVVWHWETGVPYAIKYSS